MKIGEDLAINCWDVVLTENPIKDMPSLDFSSHIFLNKGPNSKYFQFCGPYGLCQNYSILLL